MNIWEFIFWFIIGALLMGTLAVLAAAIAASIIGGFVLLVWRATRRLGRAKV